MMKKKPKLRLWQMFMLLFLTASLLFIMILWLVLTVFLDDIYRTVKSRESRMLLETVSDEYEKTGSLDLSEYDDGYDTRIFILSRKGETLAVSANVTKGGKLDIWMKTAIHTLFQELDGTNRRKRLYLREEDYAAIAAGADYDDLSRESRKEPDRIFEIKLVGEGDDTVMILLATRLYPVHVTTMSIRWVLILGTLAFAAFSVISAAFLSRRIAKPMEKINLAAARIAEGDYSLNLPESSLQEISELADTLNQTGRELQVTENLQREIIANVSHDLRTPLTMIRGYAEVMRDLPGENSPENLQIVIDETDRLSDLINDVIFVSRLQSAQETPKQTVYSLTRSLQGTLYRISKLTEKAGYVFIYKDAGREIFVRADMREIDRVLYNLIGNAVNHAGEDKTVVVTEHLENGGETARISISDHGDGIEEADLPYIWDRYYKGNNSRKNRTVGTGLGLSIAKEILDMHRARYGVESTVGKGSCFWFELPVEEKTAAQNEFAEKRDAGEADEA